MSDSELAKAIEVLKVRVWCRCGETLECGGHCSCLLCLRSRFSDTKHAWAVTASLCAAVQDRLYYVVLRAHPMERHDCHLFTVDDELSYWPFFLDYGPLSAG